MVAEKTINHSVYNKLLLLLLLRLGRGRLETNDSRMHATGNNKNNSNTRVVLARESPCHPRRKSRPTPCRTGKRRAVPPLISRLSREWRQSADARARAPPSQSSASLSHSASSFPRRSTHAQLLMTCLALMVAWYICQRKGGAWQHHLFPSLDPLSFESFRLD